MSAKKVSGDAKECIRGIIANPSRLRHFVNPQRRNIAVYEAILDDTHFWHSADTEPQLLDLYLGFRDGSSSLLKHYIFKNCAYQIKGDFTPEQEKLLVQDEFDSERRKFERLHHKFNLAQHTEPRSDRTGIPEEVRIAVWRRDNGRCVRCGSRERLEYDHIIPVSHGGSNTVRNIELLCETCNRSKGANIQ